MSQLSELATPFPAKFVSQKPGKFAASYVAHDIVTQRMLEVVGPFSFSLDELIRDKQGDVVGCLATLIVTVDDRVVSITEVGDVEPAGSASKNDGARAKDALSDAFKRCAMRLGLGLHLWAGDNYYLHTALKKSGSPQPSTANPEVGRDVVVPAAPLEVRAPSSDDAADSPAPVDARQVLADRIKALKDAKMPIADAWKKAGLPKLADCNDEQFLKAVGLVDRLEQEPF
jgi:hypothetical protein